MPTAVSTLAESAGLPPQIAWVLSVAFLALLLGTARRVGRLLVVRRDDATTGHRLASLATWWTLFLLLVIVVLGGPHAVAALFAIASLAGLREYHRMVANRVGGGLWLWAIVAVPIHYLIVAAGTLGPFWTFIPVWVLGVLLVRLVVGEETKRFLETAGTVFLGLMILVYLLSHAALIVTLPLVPASEGAGMMGMFVFLVLCHSLIFG